MSNILQLENFAFTHFSVHWYKQPNLSGNENAKISLNSKIDLDQSDETKFAQLLEIHIGPEEDSPKCGYDLELEIEGTFSYYGSVQGIIKPLEINGAMILYGILRGQVASMTGLFPLGKMVLPTLDMASLLGKKFAQELETKKAKSPKKAIKPKKKQRKKILKPPPKTDIPYKKTKKEPVVKRASKKKTPKRKSK